MTSHLFSALRYLSVLSCLSSCTSIFFFPSPELILTPSEIKLPYQTVKLFTHDGTPLHGWFIPATKGPAKAKILFLHGNAQNVSYHLPSIAWLPAEGYSVLTIDYRGFGVSEGSPTVSSALSDGEDALRYLDELPPAHAPIIIFGQSLGGALSLSIAAQTQERTNLRAVVIDSAFSDYRAIVRDKIRALGILRPFAFPISWIINDRHSPRDEIAKISPIPLLILHGSKDHTVDLYHAQELYKEAGEPKELWITEGADHIQSLNFRAMRERLLQYLANAISLRSPVFDEAPTQLSH